MGKNVIRNQNRDTMTRTSKVVVIFTTIKYSNPTMCTPIKKMFFLCVKSNYNIDGIC